MSRANVAASAGRSNLQRNNGIAVNALRQTRPERRPGALPQTEPPIRAVPYGNEGWGKRAVLDVEMIRAAT
jgi:hypothetical protein